MEQETSERGLDEINEVLQLAKLSESEIVPTSQVLYFSKENVYNHNLLLLELQSDLLDDVQQGKTLYIKGDDDENVVICSNNKTFHVVQAETSNTLLLVNNMEFFGTLEQNINRNVNKVEAAGIFHEYLEYTIGKPRLDKVNFFLSKSTYKGPEHEFEINQADLLTFDDLDKRIQASTLELQAGLETMDVVTIDNKLRLLDFEYHFRVLSYMLKLIDEQSWALDEVDYETTCSLLSDLVPREVLNCLFDKYAEESKIIDGLQLYAYKETLICKFFAQVLLHDAGKFNLEDFLQAWQDSVPEGMTTSEDMLHGLALIDRKGKPNVIWAYHEGGLPVNVPERFRVLFETKEKWTAAEISPYIQRLTTDTLDVNALLAKHARTSKVGDIKYYSAKHSK